jgi:hypothetical protein
MHTELVIIMTIVWGFILFIISTIVLLKLGTVEISSNLQRSLHQLFYLYDTFGLFLLIISLVFFVIRFPFWLFCVYIIFISIFPFVTCAYTIYKLSPVFKRNMYIEQIQPILIVGQFLISLSLGISLPQLYGSVSSLITCLFPATNARFVEVIVFFSEMAALALFFTLLFSFSKRRDARREQASFFRYMENTPGKEQVYGFHPLRILHQLQEGMIPAGCLVFRPKSINTRLFIALILPITTFPWMFFFLSTLYYNDFVNNTINFTEFLNALVLSVCIAAIIVALILRSIRRWADAILILFPEGVVQCEHCSDEAKRYFNVISFANLLHLEARTLPRNKNVASLKLQYKGGNEEELIMDNKFGSAARMAQRAFGCYTRYVESYSPRLK